MPKRPTLFVFRQAGQRFSTQVPYGPALCVARLGARRSQGSAVK